MKAAPGAGGLLAWLDRVLVWSFWRIMPALIISLALVALLIWALEHKSNPKEFGGDGSPWRKPVDRALLHRLASPEWRDLLYRYLGSTE